MVTHMKETPRMRIMVMSSLNKKSDCARILGGDGGGLGVYSILYAAYRAYIGRIRPPPPLSKSRLLDRNSYLKTT